MHLAWVVKTDYTCKSRENKVGYIVLLMEIKLKARYVIEQQLKHTVLNDLGAYFQLGCEILKKIQSLWSQEVFSEKYIITN